MSHWKDRLRHERIGQNWRQEDLADQLGTRGEMRERAIKCKVNPHFGSFIFLVRVFARRFGFCPESLSRKTRIAGF